MAHLQKEIQASRFENIFQQSLVNVIYTYHWNMQQVKGVLKPFDITSQQYNVLRILRGQYPSPATVSLIKSRILDKMSDASRIIDRLIEKGYLEKSINHDDKRALDVMINEKGLDLLKKLDKEVDFSSFIAPNLTEEEALQLNFLLDKMRG